MQMFIENEETIVREAWKRDALDAIATHPGRLFTQGEDHARSVPRP